MRGRAVLLALAVVLTLVAYAVVLVVTGFVACGISGCSGGGFGPAFSPTGTQVSLLVAGLVPLPLALAVLSGASRLIRAAGGFAVVAAGTLAAMVLLGLGPHGCPYDHVRITDDRGKATCLQDDRSRL